MQVKEIQVRQKGEFTGSTCLGTLGVSSARLGPGAQVMAFLPLPLDLVFCVSDLSSLGEGKCQHLWAPPPRLRKPIGREGAVLPLSMHQCHGRRPVGPWMCKQISLFLREWGPWFTRPVFCAHHCSQRDDWGANHPEIRGGKSPRSCTAQQTETAHRGRTRQNRILCIVKDLSD